MRRLSRRGAQCMSLKYVPYFVEIKQVNHVHSRRIYSEGQNCSTKGQISLVSQIVAQRTKGKLWENCMTRVGIFYFVMPNDRHLASFVDFILTLQWDQCSGTVLSLPLKVALYTWIT